MWPGEPPGYCQRAGHIPGAEHLAWDETTTEDGRFKPTGERTTLRLRELIEIQNGLITYSNVSLDVHDLTRQLSIIDYDSLASHLDRIDRLRSQLAEAGDDKERRRYVAERIGRELDAARLAVRPWFRS